MRGPKPSPETVSTFTNVAWPALNSLSSPGVRLSIGPPALAPGRDLPRAAVGQQRLGDLIRGGLGQGDQQRVGVPAPAGEIHRANRLAGRRVMDRHPGAREVFEVLGVVLVA